MRKALFLLTIPGMVSGKMQIDNNADTSTNNINTQPGHPYTPAGKKIVFWESLYRRKSNFHEHLAGPMSDAIEEDEEDEFTSFDDFENRSYNDNENAHDNRNLKSSSDSRSSDENFWKQAWKEGWGNSANYDKYINGDDDWSIYIGDENPTLLPLSTNDMFGFMLASLGATLGSLGGIGGGGLVIPCYVVVTKLDLKQAIPLGSVTVLGGSIAALMLNMKRRHPLADRPIIDWDLILVMEPLVLVGTIFGSIFHRVMPGKVLSVLLVLLLSIVAHTTLTKARRMYDAEKRYIEHLKSARSDYLTRVASFRTAFRMSTGAWSDDALHGAGMDPESKASYLPPEPVRTESLDSQSLATTPISPKMDMHERQRILILNPDFVTLRSDMLEQEKITPRGKVMALIAKFSVLMFLNITLGGGAFRSPWGIQCGGVAFWVVHIIMIAFLISSAWAAQVCTPNSFG
ncbi:unnamed protein product [Pseudo-nitzschia multistriata]|uniref:Membrane transporter protein n=1 Tax=Pseudo-nitzschia multistriata TaxID=183589 RepID=A0A448YU97_9STRA|nr:unnamed protein product [Pseudo-nitzschia multistriata]